MTLAHVTVDTGDHRASPRSEVSGEAIAMVAPMIDEALRSGRAPIPGPLGEGLTVDITEREGILLVTVGGDPQQAPLARFVVARDGAPWVSDAWRALHEDMADDLQMLGRPAGPMPAAPWCAVRLMAGLAQHPDAVPWLGDFERVVAWAWLERPAGDAIRAAVAQDPRARDLVEDIARDPVLRDWLRLHDGEELTPEVIHLRNVEDVLGFRGFLSMEALGAGDTGPAIATVLQTAVPFLWLSEVVVDALATRLPAHTVGDEELPHPTMLWLCERPIVDPEGGHTIGWVIDRHPEGMRILHIRALGDQRDISMYDLPWASRWPDDVPDDALTMVARVLQLRAFLLSPYLPKAQGRLPRALRKTYERVGWHERPQDQVGMIDLRTPEEWTWSPEGRPPRSVAGSGGHDHRWLVRGHFRAQWYPSKQTHQVIWIPPYIKGPEDAPYKPKTYRVVH